jgi:hypothetical protein
LAAHPAVEARLVRRTCFPRVVGESPTIPLPLVPAAEVVRAALARTRCDRRWDFQGDLNSVRTRCP